MRKCGIYETLTEVPVFQMADVWTDKPVAHAYRVGHLPYPAFLATDVLDYYRELMSGKEKIPLAVDVACGSGQFTFPLASVSDKVIGLDISEAQIEEGRLEAKERGLTEEQVSFMVGSAYDLLSLDLKPDVVTLFTTLHHLDPKRFLEEACAAIKPGGILAMFMVKVLGFGGPAGDAALKLYSDFVNAIWSKSDKNHDRSTQEALYREIEVPLDDVKRVDRFAEVPSTKEKFEMYLSSFSGFVRYRAIDQKAADADMKAFLTEFWQTLGSNELISKNQYIIVFGRKIIF